LCALVALGCAGPTAAAVDELHLERDGARQVMRGSVLARDGHTMIFRSLDQRTWRVACSEIIRLTPSLDDSIEPSQMQSWLAAQFPGCRVLASEHYLILCDFGGRPQELIARLLERVYAEFYSFWRSLGWELSEPAFPLVVVVLARPDAYARQISEELGAGSGFAPSFYGLNTNRVVVHASAAPASRPWADFVVGESLSNRTLVNLVHEATHQLMMNSGLQIPLADNPLWVSEGIAAYFEPTSEFTELGWRSPGQVNEIRIPLLKSAAAKLTCQDIVRMMGNDEVFRTTDRSAAYYSLAWGWNHFLFQKYSPSYVDYLQHLAETSPLQPLPSEQRVETFCRYFEPPLDDLVAEFRRYCCKLR
jgi:hypothetical protein